jgi:hypothetical protein
MSKHPENFILIKNFLKKPFNSESFLPRNRFSQELGEVFEHRMDMR